MNGTTRRRLRLVALAAAIPLALTTLSAPAAVAAPKAPTAPRHDQVVHLTTIIIPSTVEPLATLTTGTYVGDSISYIISHYTGFHLGPNRHTGYGEATISSITKALCAGCTWYQASLSITNHQPLSPLASTSGATTTSSFCWPWDNQLSCSSWNNVSSWDWSSILKSVDLSPLDTHSTWDRIYACYQGVTAGVGMRGTGSLAGTVIDGLEKIVHLNAASLAWSAIGGCTMGFVHLQ